MSRSDSTANSSSSRGRAPILAITALVLALVPCCPPAGVLGMTLGFVAWRRALVAEAAGLAAAGRRLALAAMILGCISAVVWFFAIDHLLTERGRAQEGMMSTRLTQVLEAASVSDTTAVTERWSKTQVTPPTADEIAAFGTAMRERFGAIDRIAVISIAPTGSLFSPVADVACVFHFETASPPGSARFRLVAKLGQFAPTYELQQIIIEDPARGDLLLDSHATP